MARVAALLMLAAAVTAEHQPSRSAPAAAAHSRRVPSSNGYATNPNGQPGLNKPTAQGGISPPSGLAAVATGGGAYSVLVGTLSVLFLALGSLVIQQYNHLATGVHMLKTWEFYFDWIFACLVGVTWAELLIVVAPDDYTTIWVVGLYSCLGTLVYPMLSIAFSSSFLSTYDKLKDGRERTLNARFRAGFDLLLCASFAMADSVSHSLVLSVWVNDYLDVDTAPTGDTASVFFWLGIAVAVTAGVTLLRLACLYGARALNESQVEAAGMEFSDADANQDDQLSSDEWLQKFGSLDGFAEYDVSRNGSVSSAEFKAGKFAEQHRELSKSQPPETGCCALFIRQLWASISLYSYSEQFCLVTKASFGTTIGWIWNYWYYTTCNVVLHNVTGVASFWNYFGYRTLIGVVLFPVLDLVVPVPHEDSGTIRREVSSIFHGICVVTLAYILADFVYYFCCDIIADQSSEGWGQAATWVLAIVSCVATPPLCLLLGGEGWSCTEGRWWMQRLRNFWIEELKWLASFNIWYAWWATVGDISDKMSHHAIGYRLLLALGLSLSPCAIVMLVWLFRFHLFVLAETKHRTTKGVPSVNAQIISQMPEVCPKSQRTLSFIMDSFIHHHGFCIAAPAELRGAPAYSQILIPSDKPDRESQVELPTMGGAPDPHLESPDLETNHAVEF